MVWLLKSTYVYNYKTNADNFYKRLVIARGCTSVAQSKYCINSRFTAGNVCGNIFRFSRFKNKQPNWTTRKNVNRSKVSTNYGKYEINCRGNVPAVRYYKYVEGKENMEDIFLYSLEKVVKVLDLNVCRSLRVFSQVV